MKRKEILVGLMVTLALVLLFFGINFLKGVNIFKAANYYYAGYSNVEGLATSAPVTLNGYKVGLVRNIKYQFDNPGNVVVEFSVDKELRLPRNTQAVISSDLLGTASIVLRLGDASEGFYAVGDTVPGSVNAGLMGSVNETIMPAVSAVIPKVDTLLTSLNTLVSDPALATSVRRIDDITLELDASVRSLRSLMEALAPTVQNVNSITTNVDTITGNLTVVSAALAEAPVDSLMNELNRTAANLEQLTAALNNPDSSIGRLTSDPELYNNINATVMSLDSLFVDIKRNPKRYISIKLL
ncbi:MAG: MlaD family protein [Muribaculaceae bacterium]|nr:MlaD family protein [Muribaculaceae bacterium]